MPFKFARTPFKFAHTPFKSAGTVFNSAHTPFKSAGTVFKFAYTPFKSAGTVFKFAYTPFKFARTPCGSVRNPRSGTSSEHYLSTRGQMSGNLGWPAGIEFAETSGFAHFRPKCDRRHSDPVSPREFRHTVTPCIRARKNR